MCCGKLTLGQILALRTFVKTCSGYQHLWMAVVQKKKGQREEEAGLGCLPSKGLSWLHGTLWGWGGPAALPWVEEKDPAFMHWYRPVVGWGHPWKTRQLSSTVFSPLGKTTKCCFLATLPEARKVLHSWRGLWMTHQRWVNFRWETSPSQCSALWKINVVMLWECCKI